MRLNLAQQLHDNLGVGIRQLTLLDTSGLVERQVEEVGVGAVVQTECAACCTCLCTADGSLQIEQCAWFGLIATLIGDNLGNLIVVVAETEFACRVNILKNNIIVNSYVARSLVCNVHIVTLLH